MSTHLRTTTLATPVGPYTMIVDGDALCVAGFTADAESLRDRLPDHRRSAELVRVAELGAFTAAVEAYFAGAPDALDALPVDLSGDGFRTAAWKAMRAVPAGETVTYRELAALAGSPGAVRAAGSSCATNLLPLVVPCHRVVRSGGGLGGYYYGVEMKRWLLAHERAERPAPLVRGEPNRKLG